MATRVRDFAPADLPQVVPFVVSIQNGEFGIPITAQDQPDLRDVASYYIAPGGHFWVADDEGTIVGTLGLLNIGHEDLALRKMFVAATHRGRDHGVAQRLLAAALTWATDGGFKRILLGTTDVLQAAHRFYEKHSFTQIAAEALPAHFPRMPLDTRFYSRDLTSHRST